jgi:hypothetical protein
MKSFYVKFQHGFPVKIVASSKEEALQKFAKKACLINVDSLICWEIWS